MNEVLHFVRKNLLELAGTSASFLVLVLIVFGLL